MTAPTPVLALGLRMADAERRQVAYDVGGPLHATTRKEQADRLNVAAAAELWALTDIVCDLPAETLTDVLVHLHAAALIGDSLEVIDEPGPAASADRLMRAITGAIRVLLEVPGVMVDGLDRNNFEQWQKLRWPGELPPVRVDAAGPA